MPALMLTLTLRGLSASAAPVEWVRLRSAWRGSGRRRRRGHAAQQRPDDVDPDVRQLAGDQGGPEGADGVDRSSGDGAADEHGHGEGGSDGDGGEAGGYAVVGGDRDHDEHEDEGDQRFDE